MDNVVIIGSLWITGMRRSEVAWVQVENFDFAAGFLTIPISKTGKIRSVPLPPAAVEALSSFLMERTNGAVTQLTSGGFR
jgi:integrase